MRIFYTPHFQRSFKKFPVLIKERFRKQIDLLLNDVFHPSLQVKKYDRANEVWQARVDSNVRFYFLMKNDHCILLDIKRHPK